MTKEESYKRQLEQLGVYDPAFDAEIKDLCTLERERHRARKAWKATAPGNSPPDVTDPLYKIILQLDRDILTHRNSLGLTPKGLQALRKASSSPSEAAPAAGTANQSFSALMARIQEASHAAK